MVPQVFVMQVNQVRINLYDASKPFWYMLVWQVIVLLQTVVVQVSNAGKPW